MEINAEQESLAARRAMEESTRHARDAARDAQQALHEVSALTHKAITRKQYYDKRNKYSGTRPLQSLLLCLIAILSGCDHLLCGQKSLKNT